MASSKPDPEPTPAASKPAASKPATPRPATPRPETAQPAARKSAASTTPAAPLAAAPGPATPEPTSPEPAVAPAPEPDVRLLSPRRRWGSFGATTWIAAAMLVATIAVGAVVAVKVFGGDGDAREPGGHTGFATACDGVAQEEIPIGRDVTTRYSLLCFKVTERSQITVGASPVGSDADLQLTVALGTGEVITEDDDTNGMDPEVVIDAQPGTYVLSITEWGGANPGTVRVRSSAVAIPEVSVGALPTLNECASLSGSTILLAGAAVRAAGEPYTCLTLPSPAFTKIGVRANDPASTDLTLAVYLFDGAGVPQFVRSVDDTFGPDPELNLDLEAGDYLIEVGTYEVGKAGAYSVYVDSTETYFRTDEVSSGLATLRPASCGSLPSVGLGAPLTIGAGDPMACLVLEAPRRLVVAAATQAQQDLTLEIVGFDASSLPVRYVWADEDVFGEDPNSQDPRTDLVLPAGTYVLAVNEYWGAEVPHDFVVTATPADGQTD